MGTLRRKAPPSTEADATVRITAVTPHGKQSAVDTPLLPPPSVGARVAHAAAEVDRYWAFFLWVAMIAAGMWPPLLTPLFVLAFPTPLIAGRAVVALAVWVSVGGWEFCVSLSLCLSARGGRRQERGRVGRPACPTTPPLADRLLLPSQTHTNRPCSPSSPCVRPPPGAPPWCATSWPARPRR